MPLETFGYQVWFGWEFCCKVGILFDVSNYRDSCGDIEAGWLLNFLIRNFITYCGITFDSFSCWLLLKIFSFIRQNLFCSPSFSFNNLLIYLLADLRDDKQFFVDHHGAVPITTTQVCSTNFYNCKTEAFVLSSIKLNLSFCSINFEDFGCHVSPLK